MPPKCPQTLCFSARVGVRKQISNGLCEATAFLCKTSV